MAFGQEMEKHVQGSWRFENNSGLGLVQSLRKVYMEFRKSIADTAPCMRPWAEGESKIDEEDLIKLANEGENAPQGDSGDVFYLNEVLKLADEFSLCFILLKLLILS